MFKKQQGIQYIDLKSKSGEHRKFIKVKYLGAGGFARCYQVCQQANQQKMHYALKIIKKSTILQSKQLIDRLKTQIRLHKRFSQPSQSPQNQTPHQHIARFIQSFQTQQFIYLLLQLCGNQTLNQLIRRRKFLSQQQTRFFIYQLAKGLKQIHSKNVVHRDIKLCNLFLSQGLKLKIGDFGLATEIIESRKRLTICGTANYIAPEMLKKDENGSPLGHLYEVDIWSLGVVCYTIFYGCYPFESKQQQSIYNKILQCKYNLFPYTLKQMRQLNTTNHNASNDMKDFLQNILVIEPIKRLNLQQVLSHRFLTKTGIPRQLPNIALKCALRKDTLQKLFVQNQNNQKISVNKQNTQKIENQQNQHKRIVCDQIGGIQTNGVQNDKSKDISCCVNQQIAMIKKNSNEQQSGSQEKQQLTNYLSLNQCENRNDIQKQQQYTKTQINSKRILRFKLKRSCDLIEEALEKGQNDKFQAYQNEEKILTSTKQLTLQVVFQTIQSKSVILPTIIKVFDEQQQGKFSNIYTLIIHPKLNYITKIMDRTPLNQISSQKNVDLKNGQQKQSKQQVKSQKQQQNNRTKKKIQPDLEQKLPGQQNSCDININRQRVCVKIPLIKKVKQSCMDKNQSQQGILLYKNELYNGSNKNIYKQQLNVVKQVFRYLKGYEIQI